MTTTYDHPEYRGLLAAVKAAPADDLPRKVLADWLEENGEQERAEFIRVQVELAKAEREPPPEVRKLAQVVGAFVRPEVVFSARVPPRLRSRSAELLALHGHRWAGGGMLHTPAGVVRIDPEAARADQRPVCEWHRGFLHTVRGPLAALIGGECGRCGGTGVVGGWVGDGIQTPVDYDEHPCPTCDGTGHTPGVLPALVRREPVRVVEVTDAHPLDNAGVNTYFGGHPNPADQWYWIRQTGHTRTGWEIPGEVFDHLARDEFPTPDAARSALSDGLLAWAEAQTSPAPAGSAG